MILLEKTDNKEKRKESFLSEINLCQTYSFGQVKKSDKCPYILLYRTVNQLLIKFVSK